MKKEVKLVKKIKRLLRCLRWPRYLHRCGPKTYELIPVKMSCTLDTRKKKFCTAKIRVLPAHDIKDAKPLIRKSNPKIAVADKGIK